MTPQQVRPATSFEDWTPDEEAIKILKDGAANIREDLWQDHRGQGPPGELDLEQADQPCDGEEGEEVPLAALPHVLPAGPKRKSEFQDGDEDRIRDISIHNQENYHMEVSVQSPEAVRLGLHPDQPELRVPVLPPPPPRSRPSRARSRALPLEDGTMGSSQPPADEGGELELQLDQPHAKPALPIPPKKSVSNSTTTSSSSTARSHPDAGSSSGQVGEQHHESPPGVLYNFLFEGKRRSRQYPYENATTTSTSQ